MTKFIFVFEADAMKALLKRGYKFLREDTNNSIWVFENKDPDSYDFELEYPFVLSNVMSF